jgi:hypothetical protein
MKTKIMILFILSSLAFTCEDDEDTINFTGENSLNIGDIYEVYLTDELESIAQTITDLQAIIDNNQGTAETEQQLADATLKQEYFNTEFNSIKKFEIIRPPLPCPGQDNECNLPALLEYIIAHETTSFYEISIFDSQNQLIGKTNSQSNPIADTGGSFTFKEFDFTSQYSGLVTIKVDMLDSLGNLISFEIQAIR